MKLIYNCKEQKRLDKYLAEENNEKLYSRSFILKLIESGDIIVNGVKVKKSYKLNEGDEIHITIPEPEQVQVEGEEIPFEIIYDDEYLAVINKPAGLTVHPAPGNYSGTLVNALVHRYKDNLSSGGDEQRPGIVHRLDKDTSGLLIIAKDDRTHSLLSTMFQKREIKKNYLAIVAGTPPEDSGKIVTNIARSKNNRKKMTVDDEGKEAITYYQVKEYFDYFSVLDVRIVTGRTHQIRVHLSHMNTPVLGDLTYSGLKRTLNLVASNYHKKVKYLLSNHLKRQALHAYKLEFKHPVTGKLIKVESPLPDDIKYTIDWLNKYFK